METKTTYALTFWGAATTVFCTLAFIATGLYILGAFAIAGAVLTGVAISLERS